MHGAGTSHFTLRITIQETPKSAVLKLEGRIVGPWADELGTVWREIAITPPERPVTLDLRDVTYVDASGMQILRQIYREKKPAFLTGSPLTESFAEQARRSTADSIEEND
ncbi:MAG: STAS domain-containing protein [Acidobacteriaceae bacterium]